MATFHKPDSNKLILRDKNTEISLPKSFNARGGFFLRLYIVDDYLY